MKLNPFAGALAAWNAARVRFAQPTRRYMGVSSAGVRVSHVTAMQVAAVWACIDVIAAALSSSDWNVYGGVRGAADKEVLPDDSLQYILNTRFNPEMTAQAGKRAMLIAAVGYGNGYAEIERDMSQRIVRLWPISPDRVDPRRDSETGRLFYRVTQEFTGGFIDLAPEDLMVVRGASLVGFSGDDAIARGIQSISTAVAIDQFAAAYFANGTQLGGVLEYTGKLDDPAYERLKEQWNQKHQGSKNAFKTAILEGGGKFTQFDTNAEKSQLVSVKHLSIEEICRWFRVPPHKIAHLLRATNNNIEHQGLEFSRDTLRPWVKEIEQEADYKLIAYRGPRKFVEIDVDWAEQGDYGSRATAYSTLRACGVLSVNDVLRKLGENTIGPIGDVRTMNGAAVRLEDVGKNLLPAPSQQKPASEDPEDEDDGDGDAVAAWLGSVYARIQRRVDARASNLQKAGRPDWQEEARATTRSFALELMADMSGVLGDRFTTANEWAIKVVNGTDPKIAARAALEAA